jgi:hypothetical protein
MIELTFDIIFIFIVFKCLSKSVYVLEQTILTLMKVMRTLSHVLHLIYSFKSYKIC